MSVDYDYFSFSPSRADKRWKQAETDIPAIVAHARLIRESSGSPTRSTTLTVLTPEQEELRKTCHWNYFPYATELDESALLNDLLVLDLYYGSLRWTNIEEPKAEWMILESLVKVFGIETDHGYFPTRSGWLNLYSRLDAEGIKRAIAIFPNDFAMEENEIEELYLEYLYALRPLAKDLKDNADALLFTWSPSAPINIEIAQTLLDDRADRHREELAGIAPPLL